MKISGVITLTTDFGLRDPYVGMMKGVILSINPRARIVDVTHHIAPGDICRGAAILRESSPFFPGGSIHTGVVDPGVGSSRRPIIVKTKNSLFVGPDNGLFWPIIQDDTSSQVICIREERFLRPVISGTFHGRDIFAPIAGHISKGVDPAEMGEIITDPVKLVMKGPKQHGDVLFGKITHIDHFGNLITNIREEDIANFLDPDCQNPRIRIGTLEVEGLHRTYADVDAGKPLALIGSSGFLEIAVNQGRASERLEREGTGVSGMDMEVRKGSPL